MGEKRAFGEGMVFTLGVRALVRKDDYSSSALNLARMHTFHTDILKYIQINALCYNKCKAASTLEVALTVKGINGEKNE